MAETSQQRRDRLYQEAVERDKAQKAMPKPKEAEPEQVYDAPEEAAPELSTYDKVRLNRPYKEYVLQEQTAGRQPKEMKQWAVKR